MRNTEHVAGHLAKMPSKRKLKQIQAALKLFGSTYLQWLRSPHVRPAPDPADFGLTKKQGEAIIEGAKIIHWKAIRNQ